ncbi:tumor necrosis factor receptor superfamily member wengen [Anopheles darlingi]|uniref:Putative tumor necrosis factor receptor superfamily member wengen n=1 Tax=Anopheles darlingi TaxID=43151 RepID=A0A2M4DK90_ANODA|nr:tumor necrosis factor receptor superfamily member wengen [Anopheles darlingi]XP_049529885.1 tumor necrosis factor receptor superfamily member wengen [Anopheles darlingi]XP_049529894.1 tumor necrosis factor receptor superfamily member wengen [Anopheles darlingi]XP_049529901.1 tumor necrosis factor receptor superfamily member wengen [Anopheles darlingi]
MATEKKRSGSRCNYHLQPSALVLLAVASALLYLQPTAVLAAACQPRQTRWDAVAGGCVPCQVCANHEIVLRPCQDYMDTVCGTMKDLAASNRHLRSHLPPLPDLPPSSSPEQDGSDVSSDGVRAVHGSNHHWKQERQKENGVQLHRKRTDTEEILWDWQIASLLLAVIGCLLFLLAAACVALNQSRQWRRIEKHFDADMEALSVQLVSHLASMQHLESGPIMLENFDNKRLRPASQPIEVRCVYLDQLLDEHCCQKVCDRPLLRSPPACGAGSNGSSNGNVYIEDSIDPPVKSPTQPTLPTLTVALPLSSSPSASPPAPASPASSLPARFY